MTASVFFNEFPEFIGSLLLSKDPLCITGDFNCHLDDTLNAEALQFYDILSSCGLEQVVAVPTHRSGHTMICS